MVSSKKNECNSTIINIWRVLHQYIYMFSTSDSLIVMLLNYSFIFVFFELFVICDFLKRSNSHWWWWSRFLVLSSNNLHPEKSNHDNLMTQLHMVSCSASSWKSQLQRCIYPVNVSSSAGSLWVDFSSFSSIRGNVIQLCLNSFYHCTHISIQTK